MAGNRINASLLAYSYANALYGGICVGFCDARHLWQFRFILVFTVVLRSGVESFLFVADTSVGTYSHR